MSDALQALQDQYNLLTINLDKLAAACQTAAAKEALMAQYVLCRRNYIDSINQRFQDDDPGVQKLIGEMKQHQATLTAAVADIGSIAGVITAITAAVQTGAALASKV
ncbi:MAG: hypothetical protein ACLQPN_22605 [Bryobacteraceae bacterium]